MDKATRITHDIDTAAMDALRVIAGRHAGTRTCMTRDERIEAIRRDVKECEAHKIVKVQALDEVCFLLAELDASEARVQRLTDALTAIDCAYRLGQTCIEANRRPELMCSRCAALAEGEDTRG